MRKSDERLRHQLEVQSIQIEEFLNRHDVPAEVAGGSVRSKWINFDLNMQISAGLEKIRNLGQELASTLGVSDINITKYDDRLRIAVKQPSTHAVDLLDLMNAIPGMTPMTATLGLDEADRPVLLNLLAEDIINILVAGGPEAGKTALLRSVALSLALENRQSQIQFAILDVIGEGVAASRKLGLYPLNYLPHVMFTVVEDLSEAADALAFLVSEVQYRIEQEIDCPLLVLIIDDVDKLVELGGRPIIEPLAYLLDEGFKGGLRIILGASNPDSDSIRSLLKNSIPIRLVGQVRDSLEARAITGIPDSQAEYLLGKGDFMAVNNGMIVPFQAAYITEYDLHLILDKLHRQSKNVMVARPLSIRPTFTSNGSNTNQAQYFEFDSEDRRASLTNGNHTFLNSGKPNVIEFNSPNGKDALGINITASSGIDEETEIEESSWGDDDEYMNRPEDVIDAWGGFNQIDEENNVYEDWEADETDVGDDIDSLFNSRSHNGNLNGKSHNSDSESEEIEFGWD
ncbi:MAG: FtsK/SpoIIIE domain-containing protein [Candidatus Promineifilaceae bacterium]